MTDFDLPSWDGEAYRDEELPDLQMYQKSAELAQKDPRAYRVLFARSADFSTDQSQRLAMVEALLILVKDTMANYPRCRMYFLKNSSAFVERFWPIYAQRSEELKNVWAVLQVLEDDLDGEVEIEERPFGSSMEQGVDVGRQALRALLQQTGVEEEGVLPPEDKGLLADLFLYPQAEAMHSHNAERFNTLFQWSARSNVDANNRLAVVNAYIQALSTLEFNELTEARFKSDESKFFRYFANAYIRHRDQKDALQLAKDELEAKLKKRDEE